MAVERECEWCGKELNRSQKRFCSKRCYGLAKQMRINVVCDQCGKIFKATPSKAQRGKNKFCSRPCYNQWRSKNLSGENSWNWIGADIEHICSICKKTFFAHPSDNRRFCSRMCQGQWQSQRPKEKHPRWKGGPIVLDCPICRKPFEIIQCRAKDGHMHFCSTDCRSAWYSENFSGINSPQWEGGKSFEPYTPEWTNALKKKIRERDDYTCTICGGAGKCVHHIDGDKQNGHRPENLITLCRKCHGKTIGNRKSWEARLLPIAKAAEQGCSSYLGLNEIPVVQIAFPDFL